jgi:uncharacterized protein (UPF0264 family)
MTDVEVVVADLYTGAERITSDEMQRRAVAADAPSDVIAVLAAVPQGEYALDELLDAIGVLTVPDDTAETGVEPSELSDDDLLRELEVVHSRRNDTFRHGSDDALDALNRRTAELEGEYLRRFPEREIDEQRLRSGARRR